MEVDSFRDVVFGVGRENPVVDSVRPEHKIYPRLIEETYEGSKKDFGNYKYNKSLYINNVLLPSLAAMTAGPALEYAGVGLFKELTRQLLTYGPQTSLNFLDNLLPVFTRNSVGDVIDVSEQEEFFDFDFGEYVGALEQLRTVEEPLTENEYNQFFDRGMQYLIDQPEYTFWYEPDLHKHLPVSFIGATMTSIAYALALDNMEVGQSGSMGIFTPKTPRVITSPKINHYTKGNEDVYVIRGTKDVGDIANDAILGLQRKTGFSSAPITKKLDLMEKFIKDTHRGGDIILTGHSLGSIEIGILQKRLKESGMNIKEGIGFAHPVLPPNKAKEFTFYSYSGDPLYEPSGETNHFVIQKPRTNRNIFDIFKNQHSINNY